MGIIEKITGGAESKPKSNDVVSSISGYNRDDNTRSWVDPTELFDNLEHAVRLHDFTKDGWKEYPETDPSYIKPMMNKLGWRQTVAIVWHYINPINLTSQQSQEEIALKTINFAHTYGSMIAGNWKLWDIEIRNMRQLITQATIVVNIGLSKTIQAEDGVGAFFKGLGLIRKETVNMNPNNQNPMAQFTGLGLR